MIVIGMAPGAEEERQARFFAGPTGAEVRAALARAGIDPERRVAYLNLGRCRPENDDFDSQAWGEAERRCAYYLARDLARYDLKVPLLLLGKRPVQRMLGSKARIGSFRGLWVKTTDGRPAFVARHPGQFLREPDLGERQRLADQFRSDLARMAERVHGSEPGDGVSVVIATTLDQVRVVAGRLAQHRALWAFDIESFDGGEFPSRKVVATDPCHPDFRLRGVAVAWSATRGAWLELAPLSPRRAEVCEAITPAFTSPADKTAFNGSIDEEGLVVPGWARGVRRTRDAMLKLVALSDGTHESLKLEKAVVDILGKRQYWSEVDKSRMRDLPLQDVANSAVRDACATLELELALDARMDREEG